MTTMTTLTDERLAELRRIAQAATPGPWEASENARVIEGQFDGEQTQILQMGGVRWPNPDNGKNERYYEQREANAAHIAAFDPPTVLALLDTLAAARATAAIWKQAAKMHRKWLKWSPGYDLPNQRIRIALLERQLAALQAEAGAREAAAYDLGMEAMAAYLEATEDINAGYISIEGAAAIREWATLPRNEAERELRHRLFDRIEHPTPLEKTGA